VGWIGIGRAKYYQWKDRYGQVNEHNAWVPRDHWLAAWEKQAILRYHHHNPLEGYRRLTYMMIDADVVAASRSPECARTLRPSATARWGPRATTRTASPPGATPPCGRPDGAEGRTASSPGTPGDCSPAGRPGGTSPRSSCSRTTDSPGPSPALTAASSAQCTDAAERPAQTSCPSSWLLRSQDSSS